MRRDGMVICTYVPLRPSVRPVTWMSLPPVPGQHHRQRRPSIERRLVDRSHGRVRRVAEGRPRNSAGAVLSMNLASVPWLHASPPATDHHTSYLPRLRLGSHQPGPASPLAMGQASRPLDPGDHRPDSRGRRTIRMALSSRDRDIRSGGRTWNAAPWAPDPREATCEHRRRRTRSARSRSRPGAAQRVSGDLRSMS